MIFSVKYFCCTLIPVSELYSIARVPTRIEFFLSWFVRVHGQCRTRKKREREREKGKIKERVSYSGPFFRWFIVEVARNETRIPDCATMIHSNIKCTRAQYSSCFKRKEREREREKEKEEKNSGKSEQKTVFDKTIATRRLSRIGEWYPFDFSISSFRRCVSHRRYVGRRKYHGMLNNSICTVGSAF